MQFIYVKLMNMRTCFALLVLMRQILICRTWFPCVPRQVVCWLDQWYGLSLDDIRKLEDDTQEVLQKVSTTPHDSLTHTHAATIP